jgi:hypothetical protein
VPARWHAFKNKPTESKVHGHFDTPENQNCQYFQFYTAPQCYHYLTSFHFKTQENAQLTRGEQSSSHTSGRFFFNFLHEDVNQLEIYLKYLSSRPKTIHPNSPVANNHHLISLDDFFNEEVDKLEIHLVAHGLHAF